MISIVNNLMAMNANRMFGTTNKSRAKSSEKLSSGYRINRAADDAAGLAISEKMRRQIRGLRQGTDNIGEGISLVQVADGALDEVTSCLQRMNELSIQAYNDTNSEQDRQYIQGEIEQLTSEIKRIADSTTFNEIYVLKGNPSAWMKVEHDRTVEGYAEMEYETTIPDWLKVSQKLETGNSNGVQLEHVDRDSNAVFQTSPGVYEYYGEKRDDLEALTEGKYGDRWSERITDNASAKIDFSGLTSAATASELFTDLFELIGTSIGIPCGTCTEYYGISFTGNELGLEVAEGGTRFSSGSADSVSYLNLSTWQPWYPDDSSSIFDKVRGLINSQAQDTAKTEGEKQAETRALAADIANKLCNKCVSQITKGDEHFLRASKIQGDDYAFLVYDFRDVSALANESSADSVVQVSSTCQAKVPYSMLLEGTMAEILHPLWIQCSAQVDDRLPIELTRLKDIFAGLDAYDVARYQEKEVYSKEYLEKVKAWEKTCYYQTQTQTIPATSDRTIKQMQPEYSQEVNRNGEVVTKVTWKEVTKTIPGEPERQVQVRVLVEPTPKPQPGPNDVHNARVYDPSNVSVIKGALSFVSACRATLGASQNRLEHAYNNNMNKHENTTYAESMIRDTDVAKETVALFNLNLLGQTGQAMLAQANQQPNYVLQLLQ